MAETGGKEPIIIPIGFTLDQASLDAVIKDAQARFESALGSFFTTAPTSFTPTQPGGGPGGGAEAAAPPAPEPQVMDYSKIEGQLRTFEIGYDKMFSSVEEKTKSLQAYMTTLDTIKSNYRPFTVEDFSTRPEKKEITEQITEVSGGSMFDEAQREALAEERWNYYKKWMTNVSSIEGTFQEREVPPFERVTEEGAIKPERFEDTALLAMGEEAGDFFGELLSKIGDSEFRRSMMNRSIMKHFQGMTGTPTEEGTIDLGMLFDVDRLTGTDIRSAEKLAADFETQLAKAFRSDYGIMVELTEILHKKLADAFTAKGELGPPYGIEPIPKGINVGATIVTGEGADRAGTERVDILRTNAEAMEKMLKKAEERGTGEPVLPPLPEVPGPTDFEAQMKYLAHLRTLWESPQVKEIETWLTQQKEIIKEWGTKSSADKSVGMGPIGGIRREEGETVERRWVSAEEDPELAAQMEIDNLLDEGKYGLAITLYGLSKVNDRLWAKQRYMSDFSELYAPYRRGAERNKIEEGETLPTEVLPERLPSPTTIGPTPGFGEMTLGEEVKTRIVEPTPSPEEAQARKWLDGADRIAHMFSTAERKREEEHEKQIQEESTLIKEMGIEEYRRQLEEKEGPFATFDEMGRKIINLDRAEAESRASEIIKQERVSEMLAQRHLEEEKVRLEGERLRKMERLDALSIFSDIDADETFKKAIDMLGTVGRILEGREETEEINRMWEPTARKYRDVFTESMSAYGGEEKKAGTMTVSSLSTESLDQISNVVAGHIAILYEQLNLAEVPIHNVHIKEPQKRKKASKTGIQDTLDIMEEATR